MSAKSDLAFVKEFQKATMAYLETFLTIEQSMEAEREHRFGRRDEPSEEQVQELFNRWRSQREVFTKMYDAGTAIADRYGVHEEFYSLVKAQPGDEGHHPNRRRIQDHEYLNDITDTFIRLIATIENAPAPPTFLDKLKASPSSTWRWLDERGLAKWIVGISILLAALSILKWLGYDMTTLIELVKAVRG